jgi:hypothetical protein
MLARTIGGDELEYRIEKQGDSHGSLPTRNVNSIKPIARSIHH